MSLLFIQSRSKSKTAHSEESESKMTEALPAPHNGRCDRVNECKYASPQCHKPLSEYPLDWKDWESSPLPAAPNRRWMICAGWAWTLKMVFDRRSGRYVYPPDPSKNKRLKQNE